MILRSPTEHENGSLSLQPQLSRSPSFPHAFKRESRETGDGPPIRTFEGDTPTAKFSKKITKSKKMALQAFVWLTAEAAEGAELRKLITLPGGRTIENRSKVVQVAISYGAKTPRIISSCLSELGGLCAFARDILNFFRPCRLRLSV